MTYRNPTQSERDELLGQILAQLGSQVEEAQVFLGVTRDEFVEIYRTIGEVRVVVDDRCDAGSLWIEERGRQLHIHAIILKPEARGRGIGARVIRALSDEFSPRVDEIELGVQDSNEGALRFYERVGFLKVPVETMPGFSVLRLPLRGTGASE